MGWLLTFWCSLLWTHHLSFDQQDVASLHQSMGDSTGTPIFVLTSLSHWCHLHVRDCFAKLWQVSSIRFFSTQSVRHFILCGRSVGLRKLRKVILLTRMVQCSRLALNFSDRSILLRFCIASLRISCCFYSALRQWRRGNIALITTLPAPDFFNLDNICIPGVGRKVSSLFNKDKPRTAKTQVIFGSASPNFGSPNCGQMTYSHLQTTKTNTPTRHPWNAPLTFRFHLRPAPSSVRLSASATAAGELCKWIEMRSHITWD